jgi:hypothetical protein
MKPVLLAGISIVNAALVSYGIAIVMQSRKKAIDRRVLTFLTLGVILDVTATICMIIASGKIITLHGVIGYTALVGMLTDTVISFRFTRLHGLPSQLSKNFLRWSLIAFSYWVVAYITGAILVGMR